MRNKNLIIFAAIIIIIGLVLFIKNKQNKETTAESPADKTSPSIFATPKDENIKIKTTNLSSLEKGRKEWDLASKNIKLNDKTRQAYATDMVCVFYNPDSKPFITLKSKAAFIDLNSQSLNFSGQVTAVSDSGDKITINKLSWDGKQKKLFGSKGIIITKTDGSSVTGENLEATPSEKKIEIKNNVRIKLKKYQSLFKNKGQ